MAHVAWIRLGDVSMSSRLYIKVAACENVSDMHAQDSTHTATPLLRR